LGVNLGALANGEHSCCPSPTKVNKTLERAQVHCMKHKYSGLEFS
jgi:hypothetical protein